VKIPRLILPMALVFLIAILTGCGGTTSSSSSSTTTATPVSTAAGASVTLKIYAASSLTESFNALKTAYHAAHPNVSITYNFNGSQALEQQLANGAPADIFASADESHMQLAVTAKLVTQSQLFAKNKLVVIIPASNPGHITTLKDLSKSGIKLVVGVPAVPVGKYGLQVLDKLGESVQYGPTYEKSVKANIVSQEENDKAVVTKVQLGDADAGIVYRTDVTTAEASKVTVIPIDDQYNVVAQYPIAVLTGSTQQQAAQAFDNYVLSADGQSILEKYQFIGANQ
jgi:molybdate transport system substrate-binding protein